MKQCAWNNAIRVASQRRKLECHKTNRAEAQMHSRTDSVPLEKRHHLFSLADVGPKAPCKFGVVKKILQQRPVLFTHSTRVLLGELERHIAVEMGTVLQLCRHFLLPHPPDVRILRNHRIQERYRVLHGTR
ncbi:hypothetical protein GSI_14877 [Ganoderma sinense ZZ0214-1]|uniref:Uncharacterized protein n=1 Tax=Ganoderma sinense ZZ0214-1 TaxID=1077348 RepID=A0A2G8RPX3_9APHY|nr:hypothetical protein GSI_14877 [Ganoderma sinense ZZ0214-1]